MDDEQLSKLYEEVDLEAEYIEEQEELKTLLSGLKRLYPALYDWFKDFQEASAIEDERLFLELQKQPETADIQTRKDLYCESRIACHKANNYEPLTKREKILVDYVDKMAEFSEKYMSNHPEPERSESRPEIRISARDKKPESIICLLDKVSRKTFETTKSGNYPIAVESKTDGKSGKEVNVYLDIDFSEIENNPSFKLSKPLTPYDKRIHNVICSLWEVGNQHITLSQIYREMEGKKGTPNAKQAQRIRESAEKMAKVIIEIDNQQEAFAYHYPHVQTGRTYLLPSESVTNRSVEMNGKILDYCLFLYREPPLLTYAKAHKQFTAFTPEQATLPDGLSTTEDNLQLDDYLKFRIARLETYGTKILFKTIYENCGIDDKHKRSRAMSKIRKLLAHYQKTKLIKSFREQPDGITFTI